MQWPTREIILHNKPECAAAFGPALDAWIANEPRYLDREMLALPGNDRVTFLPVRVKLRRVQVLDPGPEHGQWQDDFAEIAARLRKFIPNTLAYPVTIDGKII
jgi:hypothetical protein